MSFAALHTKTLEEKSDLRAVGLLSCGKVSRLKIIFFGLVKELSTMKTKYGTGIPCIYCLVRNNWLFFGAFVVRIRKGTTGKEWFNVNIRLPVLGCLLE